MRDPRVVTRDQLISRHLQDAGLDALICSLPKNVLLLSGYWPVVGTALAVASKTGDVRVIAPEDEKNFAQGCRAVDVKTFKPSSLDSLATASENIVAPLRKTLEQLGVSDLRIGFEHQADSEPSSYAAMNLYQCSLQDIVRQAWPSSTLVPGDEILRKLGASKTEDDLEHIRTACRLAQTAFDCAAAALRVGVTELEAAAHMKDRYFGAMHSFPAVKRAEVFVFAMSGTNSAQAHGAFAQSSTKTIESGDLVLVHCNSFADGYGTDITRTFSIGRVDDRHSEMYDAIFTARQEAFARIRPGVKGNEVDAAARSVLEARGFGDGFKHSTGHGVGFGAISPDALPRLHPKSPDVLERGMVFNVEPAIYIEGYGGIRHCDMLAVTADGFELLTPFQTRIEELFL